MITFGSAQGRLGLAVVGAVAALVVVVVAGVLARGPLARVPENTIKFAVGLLLTSFGCFWARRGRRRRLARRRALAARRDRLPQRASRGCSCARCGAGGSRSSGGGERMKYVERSAASGGTSSSATTGGRGRESRSRSALTALLVDHDVNAWWLLPLAVALLTGRLGLAAGAVSAAGPRAAPAARRLRAEQRPSRLPVPRLPRLDPVRPRAARRSTSTSARAPPSRPRASASRTARSS